MALAAVIALVVMMLAVALVLDRLWLEAVVLELTTGAEAAALAAGRDLASDELLRQDVDQEQRIDNARNKAIAIAAQNLVAGTPLDLRHTDEIRDVRFGNKVTDEETGRTDFEESDDNPKTVRVHAERSRSRWNPIALFMQGISSAPEGDAAEDAQATIDNTLVGLRPYDHVNVPALPIAVLQRDPSGKRKDTWQTQIDNRQGKDEFGFDAESGQVTEGPDGIPEIVLQGMPVKGKPNDANAVILDIGTGLQTDFLQTQVETGWTTEDLSSFDGILNFAESSPLIKCGAALGSDIASLLRPMIGQPRIILLYNKHTPEGTAGMGTIRAVEPAAGRVMDVQTNPDGTTRIVFQPTVVTTRTAVLSSEINSDEVRVLAPNKYIYKLQLTH